METPQEPSGGVNTPLTTEKPSTEAAKGVVVGIRTLMASQKMVESRVMGMLGELGTVPRGLTSLDEVKDYDTLDHIAANWGAFSKAYKDAIG